MILRYLYFIFFLISSDFYAQTVEIEYTKGFRGKVCGEEKFSIVLSDGNIYRTDLFYGLTEKYVSKRDDSTFDDAGNYIENWSPKFYLELEGVDVYNSIKKNWYTIAYDRKGGNLLYVLEIRQNGNSLDIDGGKYYFTKLGYERFCR